MDFMFEDEVDEVGSDVEAYCPKCKGDTTHVVISKYEDEIRRVQCNPCGDVHSFRKPRGDVEDDVPEPIAAKKRAMMKKVTWEEFFHKHGEKGGKPYEFRELYHDNAIVTHPKFGRGFVSEVLSDSKVEITFKDSRRVLVHNRKDMPGLPLAAEGDGRPSNAKVPAPPPRPRRPRARPRPPPRKTPAPAKAPRTTARSTPRTSKGTRQGAKEKDDHAHKAAGQGRRAQGEHLAGGSGQEPQGGLQGPPRPSREGRRGPGAHRQAGARRERLLGQARRQGRRQVGRQEEQEVAEPDASRDRSRRSSTGRAARRGRRARACRPRRRSRASRRSSRSRARPGTGT